MSSIQTSRTQINLLPFPLRGKDYLEFCKEHSFASLYSHHVCLLSLNTVLFGFCICLTFI